MISEYPCWQPMHDIVIGVLPGQVCKTKTVTNLPVGSCFGETCSRFSCNQVSKMFCRARFPKKTSYSSRLCPSGYTGLRPIPGLCTMFAECYKVIIESSTCCMTSQGRAYVKQCPPGTQFCTIGNICDFPSKAKSPFSTQISRLRATNY